MIRITSASTLLCRPSMSLLAPRWRLLHRPKEAHIAIPIPLTRTHSRGNRVSPSDPGFSNGRRT